MKNDSINNPSGSVPTSTNNNNVTTDAGTKKVVDNTTSTSTATTTTNDASRELMNYVWFGIVVFSVYKIANAAYEIRLGAINEFGPVIHEFDPYFNYRATEYLYWNGAQRFFQWFDHKVWYPLGRPVGTTIYPGMQFTAVYLKRYILDKYMSLNDICCYIPAWFGVIASIVTGFIAYECSIQINTSSNLFQFIYNLLLLLTTGKGLSQQQNEPVTQTSSSSFFGLASPATECAVAAMAMMSIVPAHLMRSMGGGYDNESVAVTAMVTTFYCWIRSLRTNDKYAYLWGIITGLSYFYMVAAWGGYVFVLNLIGVHAAVLVAFGRFDTKTVYRSYTLFYIVGTYLAIQVPVVGYAPIKSLEQLGPCAVFIGYQLLYVTETIIQQKQSIWTRKECYTFRIQVIGAAIVVSIIGASVLAPTGYFGPLSSRVRGLFVKHTKTGNPLVDSVAEHQPASSRAYFQYLHHVCSLAPFGFIMVLFRLSNASSFLIVWGMTAYFFSHKMVRLILLTAPIGSVLGGIAAGRMLVWCVQQWWESSSSPSDVNKGSATLSTQSSFVSDGQQPSTSANGPLAADGTGKQTKSKKSKKVQQQYPNRQQQYGSNNNTSFDGLIALQDAVSAFSKTREGFMFRRAISVVLLIGFYLCSTAFITYSWRLQQDLANPTIIMKARRRDGVIIKVDDYREAYWWLRDNTPEDARIMAWWDYGYQISAIANRTTLADGNTWNHEHIALLGKALTTDLDSGWEIARHLADYVLIWGGGGGDDLAKSPHLARIANSVYRDHCPDDPTCRAFGFVDRQGTPSSMMRRSLLYGLHGHKIKPDVEVSADKFTEVYRSTYGKVRIYKVEGVSEESKRWVADPVNRKCDAPGSWFCPGQYPPGLNDILSRKKDFQQLEDFNRAGRDHEYVEQYFRDLQDPEAARRKILEKEHAERVKEEQRGLSEEEKRKQMIQRDEVYNTWADTDDTTIMWRLISTNDVEGLKSWLEMEPIKAFIRSKDGRGPMWWAFEQRNEEITKLLMKAGVPHTDVDAKGLKPMDLIDGSK